MYLAEVSETVVLKRIHDAEKRIAHELTRYYTEEIVRENRFVASIQIRLRRMIAQVDKIIPREISPEQIPSLSRSIAAVAAQDIAGVVETTEAYFTTLAERITAEVTAILEREISKIERGTLQEAQAIKPTANIFKVDKEAISKHLDRVWTKDGKTWQQRAEEIKAGGQSQFSKLFKSGLDAGKGYKEIAKDIKKALATDSFRIEKIIRTEGQRIQNEIALESYKNNSKYIDGIEYTSTLDVLTCVECGSYDRTDYYFEGVQKNLPDVLEAPLIPVHPLCRCFYCPITKFWEDYLGKDWQRERASQFGPVTGNYEDFLRRQARDNPDWIKAHLGKFYEDWQKGRSIETLKFSRQATVGDYLRTLAALPRTSRPSPPTAQPESEKWLNNLGVPRAILAAEGKLGLLETSKSQDALAKSLFGVSVLQQLQTVARKEKISVFEAINFVKKNKVRAVLSRKHADVIQQAFEKAYDPFSTDILRLRNDGSAWQEIEKALGKEETDREKSLLKSKQGYVPGVERRENFFWELPTESENAMSPYWSVDKYDSNPWHFKDARAGESAYAALLAATQKQFKNLHVDPITLTHDVLAQDTQERSKFEHLLALAEMIERHKNDPVLASLNEIDIRKATWATKFLPLLGGGGSGAAYWENIIGADTDLFEKRSWLNGAPRTYEHELSHHLQKILRTAYTDKKYSANVREKITEEISQLGDKYFKKKINLKTFQYVGYHSKPDAPFPSSYARYNLRELMSCLQEMRLNQPGVWREKYIEEDKILRQLQKRAEEYLLWKAPKPAPKPTPKPAPNTSIPPK